MARKPLITPGSILPPQEEAPQDLLSRIVAKDRARRTGEDVAEAPAPSDAETQVPVNTEIREPVNPETRKSGNTGMQEAGGPETRRAGNTGSREHRSADTSATAPAPRDTDRQKTRNTGPRTERPAPVSDCGAGEAPEPADKATFDLPRSLHQRLKVQAAMERRPARAIVIELLTRYLDEHPLL